MRAMWLLLAAVIALLGTWHASTPPSVLSTSVPAVAFSAERAMADVRLVGRAAHPAGSAEHARVRAALVTRMTALGLAPLVAAGRAAKWKTGAAGVSVDGAEVRNIVGVLPGRDRRLPGVLLMAHYDSVPGSPGAADDGAGIAAALEIVRALRAGGAGARDLILLFTDAEEDGLLGARAFFAGDPAAARAGFVVNMDMRGGAGRAIMHETGRDAGGAIALYRRTAVRPTTDSIAAWVERLIRNSSDFRTAVDRGLPGLNYAILDRQFDYHAASSTPERLDPRSLQHLGTEVLAVTRGLVDAPALPRRTADPAYASLLGLTVLAYPTWGGWLILGVALLLAGWAWRRARVPPAEVARAAGGALWLLLVLLLALILARAATAIPGGFTVGRPLLAWWNAYEAALALVAAGAVLLWAAATLRGARRAAIVAPPFLAALVMLAGVEGWIAPLLASVAMALAIPVFARPLPGRALPYGLFVIVVTLAVAVQAFAPAAAPTLAFAAVGGAVVLLAATWPGAVAIAAVVAGLLVAQQLSTAHLLLLAVGETIASVAAPFTLFATLALAPLLVGVLSPRRALVGGAALTAVACGLLLVVRFVDPASAATPRISQVIHVADLSSGRFHRATSLAFPDRWTRDQLGPAARETAMPPVFDHAFVAPGEPVRVTPPRIRLVRRGDGRLLLTVAGPPGTREARVDLVATVPFVAARANGLAVPLLAHAGQRSRISWVGRDVTLDLLLTPTGSGRLVARVSTLTDGWPADARPLPPRPPETVPWYDSDTQILLRTERIAW